MVTASGLAAFSGGRTPSRPDPQRAFPDCVSRAIVLGHSWGASVAVALALKYERMVKALVLASGYYYPTVRADVVALSGPAVPVLGDIVRHTVSPLLGRVMWPLLMRKIFGPVRVPEKFKGF